MSGQHDVGPQALIFAAAIDVLLIDARASVLGIYGCRRMMDCQDYSSISGLAIRFQAPQFAGKKGQLNVTVEGGKVAGLR